MSARVKPPLSTFAPELLVGRVALITGGGRGIGRITALAMARLGASVAIAARNADNLARTASEITDAGGRCITIVADIRDTESVDAMVAATLAEFGKVCSTELDAREVVGSCARSDR